MRMLIIEDDETLRRGLLDLMVVFLRRAGRAMTREQLLGEVWGHGLLVTTRSVDRCVKTLREKIGRAAAHLVAVRGVGYRWDP